MDKRLIAAFGSLIISYIVALYSPQPTGILDLLFKIMGCLLIYIIGVSIFRPIKNKDNNK